MYVLDENDGLNGYDDDGLNGGLNKRRKNNGEGTKVGKFLRKNVRVKNVNLKNAIAIGSIASSIIPGGQVAGIGAKLLKAGKAGKLATKALALTKTKAGSFVLGKVKQGIALTRQEKGFVTKIAVAQDEDPNTPNVLTPAQFNEATANNPEKVQADAPLIKNDLTPAQAQTIAEVKGVTPEVSNAPTMEQVETISKLKEIPVENLKDEVKTQMEDSAKTENKVDSGKNDDTSKTKVSPVMIAGGVAVLLGVAYVATK